MRNYFVIPGLPLDPATGIEARIEAESIRIFFVILNRVVILMPMFPLAIVVVFWTESDHGLLLPWGALQVIVYAMRIAMARRYLARPQPIETTRLWGARLTLNVFFEGFMWGLAGCLFINPEAAPQTAVLLVMIIGMVAGSVPIGAYWPATMYAFATAAIGMTVVRLVSFGTVSFLMLAAILTTYLIGLRQQVKLTHQANVEAVGLRFENQDLLEQLRFEKKSAEQATVAADAANVAKSKFLAAASHDLRQPLHALGLFVSVLDTRIQFPDSRPLVDNINRSVLALENLFNTLLDVSRLDAGIVEPRIADIRIGPLMESIAAEFTPQAEQRGLALHVGGPDAVVRSDPALLETILRNLAGNAIRYTPHGEVAIVWTIEGANVVIEVRDTGIGIASEDRERIFQEFVQLHNPERDRAKGLGLGLAIVDRITRLLGHSLSMRSTPGVGTVFSVMLPTGDEAMVAEVTDAPTLLPGAEVSLRVLVIDDEASVRDAMGQVLSDWGHEVIAAGSLAEALDKLDRVPDAIIADFRLREERTGIEAIRAIHERWGNAIPALIITGDTAPDRLREARDSGIDLLHKPVQPAKLRAFLRAVASKAQESCR